VIDPISSFRGPKTEVHATLLRMVDMLKNRGITTLFTSLRSNPEMIEGTDHGLSSLMDSWIRLTAVEANGERNRILSIVKSRGTSHSNQFREYRITDSGIVLIDAYVGADGVLTGTARLTQEAREQAAAERRRQEIEQRKRDLARRREALERQLAELRATMEAEQEESRLLLIEDQAYATGLQHDLDVIAASRGASGKSLGL